MQYEFLKNFPKRMKNVGLYGVLIQNSIQKTSWKQFGFLKFDEQMNLIFAVMLYIMEQSLREENCTLDDIGAYIDTINTRYLGKEISYDDCRKLGDFVVNVILSNEASKGNGKKPMLSVDYYLEHPDMNEPDRVSGSGGSQNLLLSYRRRIQSDTFHP